MTDDFDAVSGHDRIHVQVPNMELVPGDADFVADDGTPYEELTVFNHASVAEFHYVNSVNGHEREDVQFGAADSLSTTPEAVTKRLATVLHDEFAIDVEDLGIRVVDVTDDDVERI